MSFQLNPNFKKSLLKFIYASTIVASLVLVMDITLFDIPNINQNPLIRQNQLQFWICIYFLFDFFLLFLLSDHKYSYLKRYGILILISIPYINIFEYYNINISHQSFYLLKFLPILRGTIGLFLLAKLLINNKITGLFVSYIALFFSIAYLQTLIFFIFENGINPDVKTYGDVLWWASMTATTLGSNIIPITTAGKISTVILAITGITIFPIFTVYITSLVQNLNHQRNISE
ncbi:potassium channel family protein [Wohlfahrtiimonas larvae]|uniref:Potassium channel family protein n=1 Tax=Wohlfahrtiimonas larvae TaxID=1157986 RepID=A0ABP9MGP3_9GAMM|nr:potassium channel family protein [Wohlfahrtiimonas larvae]